MHLAQRGAAGPIDFDGLQLFMEEVVPAFGG
jgi:hypothetical protein